MGRASLGWQHMLHKRLSEHCTRHALHWVGCHLADLQDRRQGWQQLLGQPALHILLESLHALRAAPRAAAVEEAAAHGGHKLVRLWPRCVLRLRLRLRGQHKLHIHGGHPHCMWLQARGA